MDTLRLGPLSDLRSVQSASRSLALAAGGPARAAANPPPGPHIGSQRVPQLLGMPGVQVDLLLRAVQPEADRTLSGTAVQVIDE